MRLLPLFICVLFPFYASAQDRYRQELRALDFRKSGQPYFFNGIHQIATDGRRLFLRSYGDTNILITNSRAEFIATLGGKGNHPSEFGDLGVMAMAVQGNRLMAIDSNAIRARTFVDDAYQSSFRLKSYYRLGRLPTSSNLFAFSESEAVIPASPFEGHLAALYDERGQFVRYVGEMIPVDDRLNALFAGMNETLWLRHENRWLSIHKFIPLVTIYDGSFHVVTQYQVSSSLVQEMFDKVIGFQPGGHGNIPTPILTDAQIFRGDLYVLGGGWLHQLELETGKVKSITNFYGTGEEFSQVTAPYLTLYTFALLDSGQLILGHHAQMWDHDLWTADLPFLKPEHFP